MGEAKRKTKASAAWPDAGRYDGPIDLHLLAPAPTINGARIRELTGDQTIPESVEVILQAFKAIVGERTFRVGFCIGDGSSFRS